MILTLNVLIFSNKKIIKYTDKRIIFILRLYNITFHIFLTLCIQELFRSGVAATLNDLVYT